MDIKDLMIGDWVSVNGKPNKVTSLLVTDLGIDQIYVSEETCQVATISEYIEPIPLTVEILEKNGIDRRCYDGSDYGYFPEDAHGRLEISIDDTEIWWSINLENEYILKLNYVHELQNALRLCGIKKEIKL